MIESVQFNGDTFAAVGIVGTRKILFLFNAKEHSEPLLVKLLSITVPPKRCNKSLYILNSYDAQHGEGLKIRLPIPFTILIKKIAFA